MQTWHTCSMPRSASASMAATVMPCPYTWVRQVTSCSSTGTRALLSAPLKLCTGHQLPGTLTLDRATYFWEQVVQQLCLSRMLLTSSPQNYAVLLLGVNSRG